MNKIKIITFGVILAMGLVFAYTTHASVADMEKQLSAAAEEGAGYGSPQDPRVTVATIIRTALSLIGIIFLILTLYAGVLWMTAGGNEEQIAKAKKVLTASVIGLIIIVMAYSITLFVTYVAVGGNRDALKTNPPTSETAPFNP